MCDKKIRKFQNSKIQLFEAVSCCQGGINVKSLCPRKVPRSLTLLWILPMFFVLLLQNSSLRWMASFPKIGFQILAIDMGWILAIVQVIIPVLIFLVIHD